jgi:hypothetical protein
MTAYQCDVCDPSDPCIFVCNGAIEDPKQCPISVAREVIPVWRQLGVVE